MVLDKREVAESRVSDRHLEELQYAVDKSASRRTAVVVESCRQP